MQPNNHTILSTTQNNANHLRPADGRPNSPPNQNVGRSPSPSPTYPSQSPQAQPPPPPPTTSRRLTSSASVRRVCYFRMDPKTEIRLHQVQGHLCTHVILAFARINGQGQLVVASESDYSYLSEVPAFKRQYPHLRVLISLFNEPQFNGFPELVALGAGPDERLKFARSAVEFLTRFQLDGIDLDWEFPNFPPSFSLSSREHERQGLTKILKSLRSAIVENFYDRQLAEQHEQQQQQQQQHQQRSGSSASRQLVRPFGRFESQFESHVEPYLLTVAVGGQEAILRSSYELKQVANLCDWLNIMSYDYFLFKAYSPFTGPNAPLYPIVDTYVPFLSKLSLSWTVARLLDEGIDEDKLVMGVPTYARAYRLLFHNTQPAPFTLSSGPKGGQIEDYLNYREVLQALARDDTIVEFDQRARVPYLLTDNGYTWITYENPQSVREKVRFILNKNLGGYMTWNLNSDDFVGHGGHANGLVEGQNQSVQDHQEVEQRKRKQNQFPLHQAMLDEVNEYFAENK